jgi:hypothetical protein
MTPRNIARVLIVVGWLAGMALVLAGSLALALAAVAVSVFTAAAVLLRGRQALAWAKAHRPHRTPKAGSTLERA